MGAKKWVGEKILGLGKSLVGKSIPEAAEEVGIKFLDNYKQGMKLPKQLIKYLNVQNKPGWLKKVLKLAGVGGGAIGTEKYISSRWDKAKKMEKAKGGSVRKMKAGGSVSRGTGAAIQGTKFKGVF